MSDTKNIAGWRPISEAPRDGTPVILFIPHGYSLCGLTDGIVIGHWSEADAMPDDPIHENNQWYQLEQDGGFPLDIAPTHFMPLPPPPETKP